MTFSPADFLPKESGYYELVWTSPQGEEVRIQLITPAGEVPDAALMAHLEQIVRAEPAHREQAARSLYPENAFWLEEEDVELHSPEALLAALQWTVLGVHDFGEGQYETQLYYTGPNEFQSITSKNVVIMDIDKRGGMEAHFASYDED
jgi:hypothetical protein